MEIASLMVMSNVIQQLLVVSVHALNSVSSLAVMEKLMYLQTHQSLNSVTLKILLTQRPPHATSKLVNIMLLLLHSVETERFKVQSSVMMQT